MNVFLHVWAVDRPGTLNFASRYVENQTQRLSLRAATSCERQVRQGARPATPCACHECRFSRFGKMDGSRPISRVLSWTAIPLGRALLRGSSDQPAGDAGRAIACLFGLAPGGVCHAVRVATSAVGSYPAVSPLPVPSRLAAKRPSAVCFLLHFPSPSLRGLPRNL